MTRVFSKELHYSLKAVCDMVNVTDDVAGAVKESGIREGIATVVVTGSTAGITTLEYELNLVKDFCELMEQLVPQGRTYHHDDTWGDANGFSHLRSALIGTSVSVPVNGGSLALGTWQQLVLVNFDAEPRSRTVSITLVGDGEAML